MNGLGDLRSIFGSQGSQGTQGSTAATGTQASEKTGGTLANGTGKTVGTGFQGIDQSALSETARSLASGSPNSDVRMDKVQQLQAAIANGSYNIPTSAIADKLMQTMLGA